MPKIYGAHGPPHEAAWMLSTHRVVTQVRDPWSWYGSLYLHLKAIGMESTLEAWGNGSGDFRDVLRGWTHLDTVEKPPSPLGGIWEPYGPGPHPPMEGGFWSFTYRCYLKDLEVTLIDLPRVAEGWAEILSEEPSAHPPANVRGSRDRYRGLYTRKMREWVREADRGLIDAYGYRFLSAAKEGPLLSWPVR